MTRPMFRRAAALVAGLLVVVLTPQVSQAAPVASVDITAPTAGPVWGLQSIAVTGVADDSGTQTITRIAVATDDGLSIDLVRGVDLTCDVDQVCTGTADWTADAVGLVQITATLFATVEGVEQQIASDTQDITVAVPAPIAEIGIPTATAGLIGLEASVRTDPLDPDTPQKLELFVGTTAELALAGDPVDTDTSCTPGTNLCTATLQWDSTGVAGSRVLVVRGTTIAGATDTAERTVTFDNPAPSVSITTAGGEVGAATVQIDVESSTAAGQTDEPATLQLLQDGVVVDTFTCLGGQPCNHQFTWSVPPDEADQDYTLTAKVITDLPREATSTGVVFSTPAPTITITSPLDAATVEGPAVGVIVSASTAAFLTDKPSSVQLKVGGSNVGSAVSCSGKLTGNVCNATLPWSQAVSGDYSLTATATTGSGATATTAAATDVTLDNPPTVAITAPTTGDTVTGTIDVDITASTDAGALDRPASIQLRVDGAPAGDPILCAAPLLRTCSVTTSLDTTTLPATFALTATVTTDASPADTATSASVTVGADVPAVAITSTYPNAVGGEVDVVVAASTSADSPDFPDFVEVYATIQSGSPVLIGTVPCDDAAHACGGTITWDTTGLDGVYSLVAEVATVGSASNAPFTVASDAVAITIETPAPTASITTTFTGDQKGRISVAVSGSTDSATSDFPATVSLYREAGDVDVLVGTLPACAASEHTCSGTLEWDATALAAGTYSLYATVATTGSAVTGSGSVGATSAPVEVTVDNPPPAVLFSQAPPATVVGQVTIGVTATTDDALTEYPASIVIRAGSTTLTTVTCSGTSHTCTGSVAWDTTFPTLSGAYTITAQVTSTLSRTAAAPASAAVTVANPAMKVSITAPGSKAVIKTSSVGITVTASTTSPQTDRPRRIRVTVGGVTKEAICLLSAGTFSCTKTLSFSTSSWVGQRTVAVEVRSARVGAGATLLRTATTSRTVYGYSGTRVSITSPSTVTAGSRVTLRGRVTSTKTGAGIGGMDVRIVRDPALGLTSTSTVRTSSTGAWSLTWTPRTNTSISATAVAKRTSSGATFIASSSRSATQFVRAPIVCTVNAATVARGQRGSGSCSVADLPVGTPLALRYLFNGALSTLATGTSRSTTIPFSFTFNARGTYFLRIDLSASSRFVATSSALLPVTVT